MKMELYRILDTSQCYVTAYSTDQVIMGRTVYVIRSVRRKDGRALVRFGNKKQVDAILDSYKLRWNGRGDYTPRPEQG